ncbi:MAG TPA: nitroreductase [Asanoa sp.]|nr:nitroreductase [Asanoa sp.]
MTLSCGAALHHARTSLAVQGWHVSVARMPDRGDGDHLAQLRVDRRVPVDSVAVLHAWAVKLRHTDRRPLTGPPVGARQLEAIRAAVENEHTWLHMLTSDQVLDLASAADHAQRALADESPWRAELAYWTGGRRPTGSGIPDSAIPAEATETTVATRDFGHRGDLPVSAEHDKSAGYAMLYGNADEPFDWLCAGEALSAAWLTATEQGVSVVPLSAPIEVVGTRQAMRTIIASVGYPYLMLRLGMVDPSDGWQPHTPRLPANQIIDG